MKNRQSGFTMVELLITMAVFVLTIAAVAGIFVPLLTQFKQQSKIAETQIEGLVGLGILRRDIEHAGFGIPWEIQTGVTYQEAANAPGSTYNEPTAGGTTAPPRAILSGNDIAIAGIVNRSDYLVIKATNVAPFNAATKWTDVLTMPDGSRRVRVWGSAIEDLNANDRVIVMIPSLGETRQRILVNDGATFFTRFNQAAFPAAFAAGTTGAVNLVYGVTDPDNTPLRMPFNRADYFIRTGNAPQRCAPNTGVLVKAVLRQADGVYDEWPLLDCVADMQFVYCIDNDNDGDCEPGAAGSTDFYTNDLPGLGYDAQQTRTRVKEVRAFILAHEGQRDWTYTFAPPVAPNSITVGEFGLGRNFNLATSIGTGWQNFRWKVFSLVIQPRNLMR
ncbi:MAG: prepilin-type N-terminal cleavage/methylation domain-containing protein [Nitrospirota bacterium]